jgi:hypothetical protein
MTTRHLLAAAFACSALLLPTGLTAAPPQPQDAPVAKQVGQDDGPVTNEGFDERLYAASLYVEVPMEGVFGVDVYGDAILQTVRMAAADPYIQHVIYVIDCQQGNLLDKDIVGTHQDELEFHALVRDGLTTAVFPIFFCDTIFVVDGSRIGGLPLHQFVPQGSEEVTAKMVGIFTNQLASAAETHGHNPDIVRAMIDQTKSLHYWRENGEVHVTNTEPASTGHLQDYEHITPFFEGSTVTLDHEQAVRLGLAEQLEEYDAVWIGDRLGARDWTVANRFGEVAEQIAFIASGLTQYQELLDALDKNLPEIRRDEDNRNDPNIRRLQEVKRSLERGVSAIESINESLEALYTAHPERHTYFAGPNGTTVLADPQQWEEDVRTSQQLISRLRSGLSTLSSTFMQLDFVQLMFEGIQFNPASLDQYSDVLGEMSDQLDLIRRHGNAYYWEQIYVEPYPEDEYGVTYG